MALFPGGVVDVVVHFVSSGSLFLGILKDTAAFELEGLDEFKEFLIIGVRFAREAGDESGADGEIGDAVAHALEEITDVFPIGLTVHLI